MFDDAAVDGDGRLLVPCDDLPEDAADLSNPACLRAVLLRLREEARVRGIVLVHDRERAYGARAIATIEGLLSLARLLDHFAERPPSPNFPGFTAREVAAVCATCAFRPATVFPSLRDRLLGDPDAFVAALRDVAMSLAAYGEDGCRGCTAATIADLRVLLGELGRVGGG